MMWVYAIYNRERKKIYIGQTIDLETRLAEHNNPNNDRHTYTRKLSGKWELIYKEEVFEKEKALRREKQLKSYQGRQFIKKHIPL